MIRRAVFLFLAGSLAWWANPLWAQSDTQVFWSDSYSGVWRCAPDGSGVVNIHSWGTDWYGHGLALDLSNNKLYMISNAATASSGRIQRSNLDGTNVELVLSGLGSTSDLALSGSGKMYWTDFSQKTIMRANLDGTMTETVVSDTGSAQGIAVSDSLGMIYWTDNFAHGVRRCTLDGRNPETIWTVSSGYVGWVEVVPEQQRLYWTVYGNPSGGIWCANLDGSSPKRLIASPSTAHLGGLAVDSKEGHVYWQYYDWNAGHVGYVMQADLDGTNQLRLSSQGINQGSGDVVITPEPATLGMLAFGALVALRRKQR
jgi:hypothetical protein